MTSRTPTDRRTRLGAELRANLKRRKTQARLRQPSEKPSYPSETTAPSQDAPKDKK